jgi:hypothetical protein
MSRAADGRSSIHRRADGTGWDGWISYGTDAATGKRLRRHVRGRTKAEVADKLKALEAARARGVISTGPDVTLNSYLAAWVKARDTVVRPNTLAGYRTDLKHVERSGVGNVKLQALTAEHVERVSPRPRRRLRARDRRPRASHDLRRAQRRRSSRAHPAQPRPPGRHAPRR